MTILGKPTPGVVEVPGTKFDPPSTLKSTNTYGPKNTMPGRKSTSPAPADEFLQKSQGGAVMSIFGGTVPETGPQF